MSAGSTQLTPLLTAELRTLRSLEAALDAEYQALVDNSVDALESATAQKNLAVTAHREQQEQRLSWMHGLGLGADSSLAELVEHCGGSPQDAELQDTLAALAAECQENNRRNGGLILRLQDRTRGALDVLRREDGGPDLYSLSGSREHQSDSRTLGKA
ncbi:flagella synthesis protein FlgN [Congregibacter litoralis]|uniref:Flagellar biosynthesis/type III secretory pathway chaperone n=1 Tax=Congregibacter litoralis KT71 TaxID=314285 RepID=A4A621_9GAMM|nr:flagellar protein FlgN [Congregibacter litoralis]EAQ98468.1 Flagellar biosynthesis/type III secretory pathway chaperone [Congregibacter litoralis KT71]